MRIVVAAWLLWTFTGIGVAQGAPIEPGERVVVLNLANRGNFRDNGYRLANLNTLTGQYMERVYHSFFVFNLADVRGTITSATVAVP